MNKLNTNKIINKIKMLFPLSLMIAVNIVSADSWINMFSFCCSSPELLELKKDEYEEKKEEEEVLSPVVPEIKKSSAQKNEKYEILDLTSPDCKCLFTDGFIFGLNKLSEVNKFNYNENDESIVYTYNEKDATIEAELLDPLIVIIGDPLVIWTQDPSEFGFEDFNHKIYDKIIFEKNITKYNLGTSHQFEIKFSDGDKSLKLTISRKEPGRPPNVPVAYDPNSSLLVNENDTPHDDNTSYYLIGRYGPIL